MSNRKNNPTHPPHTYRDAGVDINAADNLVQQIGPLVRQTYGPRVLDSHGGFAGAFRLDYDERLFKKNYREPVLVSCTDGVGSKILIAIATGKLDTIGIDLVAMNVNDLLTCGAEPLFFLDYVAVNKVNPDKLQQIIAGIANGCQQAGCALLGGETAEMPDLYRKPHFDLAGFCVGVAERKRMLKPRATRIGDLLVGIESDGLHANGYALARKVLLKSANLNLNDHIRSLGETLANALIRPTRIYVKPVLATLGRYRYKSMITGMAHITGGGLPGNVNRFLPPHANAIIKLGSWPIPKIFGLLEHHHIAEEEMYRVFNMGIGYVLAVRPSSAAAVQRSLQQAGENAHIIGRITNGSGNVELR